MTTAQVAAEIFDKCSRALQELHAERDGAEGQDAEGTDGADDRRRQSEPTDLPMVFDHLREIAFAIAKSAALVPEF